MAEYVPQVGGSHYSDVSHNTNQHWDLFSEYDIDCLTYAGTKYIQRCRKKGKFAEDLEKGISYVRKMMNVWGKPPRQIPPEVLDTYYKMNKVDADLAAIITEIVGMRVRRDQDCEPAIAAIRELIKQGQ